MKTYKYEWMIHMVNAKHIVDCLFIRHSSSSSPAHSVNALIEGMNLICFHNIHEQLSNYAHVLSIKQQCEATHMSSVVC